jgi:hypothetical protein
VDHFGTTTVFTPNFQAFCSKKTSSSKINQHKSQYSLIHYHVMANLHRRK